MKSKLISFIIENKYLFLIFSIAYIIDYFKISVNTKYLFIVVLLFIFSFEIYTNEEKYLNLKFSDLEKKILYCVLVLLSLTALFILFYT
jgi:hypothetical protein